MNKKHSNTCHLKMISCNNCKPLNKLIPKSFWDFFVVLLIARKLCLIQLVLMLVFLQQQQSDGVRARGTEEDIHMVRHRVQQRYKKKEGDGFVADHWCNEGFTCAFFPHNEPALQNHTKEGMSPLHRRCL